MGLPAISKESYESWQQLLSNAGLNYEITDQDKGFVRYTVFDDTRSISVGMARDETGGAFMVINVANRRIKKLAEEVKRVLGAISKTKR